MFHKKSGDFGQLLADDRPIVREKVARLQTDCQIKNKSAYQKTKTKTKKNNNWLVTIVIFSVGPL